VNDKPARQPASLGTRAGLLRAYFSTNLAISDVRFTMASGYESD
jgi:hypothetical protein